MLAELPDVDVLVNNLGIFEAKPFEQIPDPDWSRFFETNVMSGVRLSRAYLPAMLRRSWGRVVFISSESAVQIPAEMIHYGMTKTAQLAVARGLAELTAGTGVTVNSVLAGPTKSEGVGTFVEGLAKQRGLSTAQVEEDFFKHVAPEQPAQALRDARRGGGGGRLPLRRPRQRHQRRRRPGGRRGGAVDPLIAGGIAVLWVL